MKKADLLFLHETLHIGLFYINVTLPNLVKQMCISVFNFFSFAKPQKDWKKKNEGQVSAAKDQPSPRHAYWRIPTDTAAADIR